MIRINYIFAAAVTLTGFGVLLVIFPRRELMKWISLVFILVLTSAKASAFQGEHPGNWICVFTANYRMSAMSYWGVMPTVAMPLMQTP